MKSFNIVFISILVACIGLSFITKSNFDETKNESLVTVHTNQLTVEDSIPPKDLEELTSLLQKELLVPIRECLEAKDPHVFMTKCYSRVGYDIQNHKDDDFDFRSEHFIRGQIIFTNCSKRIPLVSFIADIKESKVYIWESYKRPEVSVKDFLKEFKAYVNEKGVPGNG